MGQHGWDEILMITMPTNMTATALYGLGVMLDMTTPKVHLTIQIVV